MELSKNSNEMKTVVETFVVEETSELIYDNDSLERWNKIVDALDLKGQSSIIKPGASPIPFMFIKTSMKNVFNELCPRKVAVEDYDISPIPLEILDLVALSKKENYFNKIEIWYDDKKPDPLCVGRTEQYYGYKGGSFSTSDRTEDLNTREEVEKIIGNKHSIYETNTKYYLLGKWADVKHSFDELKQMAFDRYVGNQRNYLNGKIKEYNRELDDLETKAYEQFN